MHFDVSATPNDLPAFYRRAIEITGWKPWKRRIAWLQEQVRINPTIPFYLVNRLSLELAFNEVTKHRKKTSRLPWPPTVEQHRLYSFLAVIARLYPRLTEFGQNQLKGMLLNALKSPSGLDPLAFEMKVAAHFMSRDFDVVFSDMENGGGYDYLVSDGDIDFEVECKFISGDIGRKIHQHRIHQFGTVVHPVLEKHLKAGLGGQLVSAIIPGRLQGETRQHEEIAQAIDACFAQKMKLIENGVQLEWSEFDFFDSPFSDENFENLPIEVFREFVEEKLGFENSNFLFLIEPNSTALLLVVQSDQRDTVLKHIERVLKTAANQLSQDRPGMIWCHFSEIEEEQLQEIVKYNDGQSGLNLMTSWFLERRPQVHTLILSTPGKLQRQSSSLIGMPKKSFQEIGAAYHIVNPNHPLAGDERYSVR